MDDNLINLNDYRDPAIVKLVELGGDLDQIILHYLEKGCASSEIAIIVGHRLSELLLTFEPENKLKLWKVISDLMLKRFMEEDNKNYD